VADERDGKFDIYPPDPAMYEDLIPPPFQEGQELPEPSLPHWVANAHYDRAGQRVAVSGDGVQLL